MKFRNAMQSKTALTHNGAVTNITSGDNNVNLFFMIGASRGKDITNEFKAAYENDKDLAIRTLLWARDIRGGQGERQTFRNLLLWLEQNDVWTAAKLIPLIPELGRWDDLLVFQTDFLKNQAYIQIVSGFTDPATKGLVAKWMPRKGQIAYELAKFCNASPRTWRKFLVANTNVVEQQMCAKEWNEINFSHVPSLAATRYQKAFIKNAKESYDAYKQALIEGDPQVKVNAGAVYPHDVIKSYIDKWSPVKDNDVVIEKQWEALANYLKDGNKILPICDVSGSMTDLIPGTNITRLDVCVSLGLYIADKQKGDFSNLVMTFSDRPEFVDLSKTKTLKSKVKKIVNSQWSMGTNFEAVFEKILQKAVANNVSEQDMPKIVLVFSDMEFNSCVRNPTDTLYTDIKVRYRQAGYELPKIVFWNLNARPGNNPVTVKDENTALVSGFSPSTMKSILGAEDFSPRGIMLKTIMSERYNYN
jgi:hypothetical protein